MLETLAAERDIDTLPPIDDGPDSRARLAMLKSLLKLRITEETLASRYGEQEMRTPVHFGTGQEAVAVGVCHALQDPDAVYSHHRSHNHYLARGGTVYELAAELYGREDGCSRGRGGSVHLTSMKTGFIASSAILGETIAVAAGTALAFAMDRKSCVAVAFFGEATMEEGVVYETANFAAIHRLPLLLICENNLYSTESPLEVRQPRGTDFCERMRAFKIDAHRIDGNDVGAVYNAAVAARAQAVAGGGAVFLECMTYRWREHVGPSFDHEMGRTYRSQSELESWMERCPVRRAAADLVRRGIVPELAIGDLRLKLEMEIAADIERARHAPWPKASGLFDHA